MAVRPQRPASRASTAKAIATAPSSMKARAASPAAAASERSRPQQVTKLRESLGRAHGDGDVTGLELEVRAWRGDGGVAPDDGHYGHAGLGAELAAADGGPREGRPNCDVDPIKGHPLEALLNRPGIPGDSVPWK